MSEPRSNATRSFLSSDKFITMYISYQDLQDNLQKKGQTVKRDFILENFEIFKGTFNGKIE